jgi:hypothetical protein
MKLKVSNEILAVMLGAVLAVSGFAALKLWNLDTRVAVIEATLHIPQLAESK